MDFYVKTLFRKREKAYNIALQVGYGVLSIANQLNFNEGNVSRIINRYLQYGRSGLERLPIKQFPVEFRYKVVQYLLKNKLSLERRYSCIS